MGERFTAESRGPVVLIHLGSDGAPELAACSGQPHENLPAACYPQVPRVLCQGCARPPWRSNQRGEPPALVVEQIGNVGGILQPGSL